MPGICLNMIVRNEAAILARCLASVAPWVNHYVIADTGSTDGTQDLIRSFFSARDIPGEVVDLPFHNFEQARNGALEACRASPGTFDYVLLTDADMELVVEDQSFRDQLRAPAHLVRQVAGIAYDNIRFVKRDLPAHYVGVTHEYLNTCGHNGAPRLMGIWFRDHAEGSSRSVKSERDLQLLKGGLRDEPRNARYMFYLAQTYKDLGRFEDALRWYKRRIAAGGYEEEVWYSMYMVAVCHRELRHESAFVRYALDAFQRRPTRAEPLYLLAKYYRERGQSDLSVLMCESGMHIPLPKDDHLFIEPDIYTHGFQSELSISGFYCARSEIRARAYAACMDLATDVTAPTYIGNQAVQNTQFHALSGEKAFGPNFRTRQIDAGIGPPGFYPTNPSIAALDLPSSTAIVNIRWVDYVIGRNPPDGIYRTRNRLAVVKYDDAHPPHAIIQSEIVDRADEPPVLAGAQVRGYEDLRIFRWRDHWHATATVRDRRADMRCEIALLDLEVPDPLGSSEVIVRRLHVQHAGKPDEHQKNWVPLVDGDRLLLIYEADPTLVLEVDPTTMLSSEIAWSLPTNDLAIDTLRGSSQAVPFAIDIHGNGTLEAGWLYVAHEAFMRNGRDRRYTHRLVWLGPDLQIRYVSDPFYFHHQGVEFCAGLVVNDGHVVMSYGVEDSSAWLASADRAEVERWLLEPARRRAQRAPDRYPMVSVKTVATAPSGVSLKSLSTPIKTARVAVCAIAKNEARYIEEWIAFHLLQGVTEILVFDNESTDGTRELLERIGRRAPVTTIHWPGDQHDPMQRSAYLEGAKRLADRTDWIAFIDLDEFIFCRERVLPLELASFGPEIGAIGVGHRIFGSSGLSSYVPDLVTKRFTQCSSPHHPQSQWFKTLARPRHILNFDSVHSVRLSHGAYVTPDGAPLDRSNENGHPGHATQSAARGSISLFHYMTKSREEYHWKQLRFRKKNLEHRYDEKYFLDHDAVGSDMQNDELHRFEAPILEMIASWA